MRARNILVLVFIIALAPLTFGQVTHGQKPKLPAPFATKSAGNAPEVEKPPAGFLPTVPPGFAANVFATNFKYPRWLTVAPNGDIFLADSGSGEIVVMRDPQKTGKAQQREIFVEGQNEPFGIVFHENYVYVGNTNEVARFRYDPICCVQGRQAFRRSCAVHERAGARSNQNGSLRPTRGSSGRAGWFAAGFR